MKSSAFIISFVVALVAGALAGAAASLFLDARQADSSEVPAVSIPAPDPATLELAARIDTLVEENRALRERLVTLEALPGSTPRIPVDEPGGGDDFVSREDFEAFRGELEGRLASGSHGGREPAKLQADVADALSVIRKDEQVEAVREAQEKRAARLEGDMAKLEGWLDLAPYQADSMRTSLLVRYERDAELRRLWEEGAERDFLAQRKQEDRAAFRSDLEQFLEPDQLEKYWSGLMERGKE